MTPAISLFTTIEEWREEVAWAVFRWENQRRVDKGLKPLPNETEVDVQSGPKSDLLLLNLKVWRDRYCVSLAFIIEVLLEAFKKYQKFNPDKKLALKVPLWKLTGPAARGILEQAVKLAYPSGENFRVANQPTPNLPLESLEYENATQFVARYQEIMTGRQSEKAPTYQRKFRKRGVQ